MRIAHRTPECSHRMGEMTKTQLYNTRFVINQCDPDPNSSGCDYVPYFKFFGKRLCGPCAEIEELSWEYMERDMQSVRDRRCIDLGPPYEDEQPGVAIEVIEILSDEN